MAVVGADIMRANGNDSFGSSAMGDQFIIRNGKTLEGRFTFADIYNVACKALIEADAQAAVTARTGKPLPMGGGEAGRAFVEYMSALENARTLEEAARVIKNGKASMTEEAQTMDETKLQAATAKEKKDAFELVRIFYVIDDVKITGGFINQGRATLNVVGVQDKDEVKGEVNMHLEGGQWKVGKASVAPTGKFVRPKPAIYPPAHTAAKNVVMAKSNGTVAGTFSVAGKMVNLKYVYAMRRAANPPISGAAIELFLTDQPVPEAILRTIAAKEMRLFYLLEDYFKGTSITGIYFWVGGSGKPDKRSAIFKP